MKVDGRFARVWFLIAFAVAVAGLPLSLHKGMSDDFLTYVGQSECVVNGVDPYDVWAGNVQSDRYYPFERTDLKTEARDRPIQGNTPWFYTYFLPFVFCGTLHSCWIVWEFSMLLLFLIVVAVCY